MKSFQRVGYTVILVFTIMSFAAAQDASTPGGYMDAIAKAHEDMNKKYMAYMSAAGHGRRARKVEKLRTQVLESILDAKINTKAVGAYKGDNSLKESSVDYIQLCYNVFNEDYAKIVNMEEIAEQSYDEMQAYILLQEKTSEKLNEASDKLNAAEKAFAAKYEINLIESKSELSEKMEVAGKLNHYTNQLFLIFFKCNWEDGVIIKAMNDKKVNDIEQGRNALIKYAEEGLKALDTMKNFQGDASLATVCRQVLTFYRKMAENDIPKLTDFYLKEENFQKIKKAFESKSQSKRTEADVDGFNKAVNDINNAVTAYNRTNDIINDNRKQVLGNWERTEKEFTDRNMPYYKGKR
jgi:hypothetical protein